MTQSRPNPHGDQHHEHGHIQEGVTATLHARIDDVADAATATAAIKAHLKKKLDIYHAEVETDEDGCADR